MLALNKRLLGLVAFAAVLINVGCEKPVDPNVIADAQLAFEAGQEHYKNGQFEAAAEAYGKAVDHGGLNVDSYCEAQIRRAEALARTGRCDEAHAILIDLEQGAPDMAAVHIVRSFTFEKQGNSTAAGEQYRKARQFNPDVQKLKD